MAFPQEHVDQVLQAHKQASLAFLESARAVADLLAQTRQLGVTQEKAIEQFRARAGEVPPLRLRVQELEKRVAEMAAHPDVRAAQAAAAQEKLKAAEAQAASARAEVERLQGAAPNAAAPGSPGSGSTS